MLTSFQTVFSVIRYHERSIVVSIAKGFLAGAGRRGVIRGTAEGRFGTIRGPSFAGIREFEIRSRRMDALVSGGFLDTDVPERLNLTPAQLGELRYRFKRALYATDELGDLGLAVLESGPSVGQDGADEDVTHPADYARTRAAQVLHIRSMPTLDLVSLAFLLQAAQCGYLRYRIRGSAHPADPAEVAAASVAFKEAILRRGSLVLYGFVRGSWREHKLAEVGMLLARAEMRLWEARETSMPDGLHMTLLGEMGRRLVGDDCARPDYAKLRNREMAALMGDAIGIRVKDREGEAQGGMTP